MKAPSRFRDSLCWTALAACCCVMLWDISLQRKDQENVAAYEKCVKHHPVKYCSIEYLASAK